MPSTASVVLELMVWVAPSSVAVASFRSSMSTAMILVAPASRAPAIAAAPTPPQPITATESPRLDVAGVDRRAEAGHHAAAEQAGDLGGGGRVDLGALTGGDQGLLDERADPQRRVTARCRPPGSSSGWR